MAFKIITVLSILTIPAAHLLDMGLTLKANADNYGPYVLDVSQYEHCKGPKSRDVANFDIKMVVMGNVQTGLFNITFFEHARVEEIKISVFKRKGNSKTLLWNYKLNNPCQHFALGAVFRESYKADDNCVVKKGNYKFPVIFGDYAKNYLGTSFFYGKYEIKTIELSSKGNIMCFITYPAFIKKTNGNT